MFFKVDVLKILAIFKGKHLCWSLCFFKKKETPAQVFSCEYCINFTNTIFKTPPMAASMDAD